MTTLQLTAAIRDRLATYLQTELVGTYPALKVSGAWPTPGKPLPSHAITVLASGPAQAQFHAPMIRTVTPGVSPSGTVMYTYGRITLPLQLDAWATYESVRDALALSVETKLNRHPADTLGLVGGIFDMPRLKHRPGLVLTLPNLLGLVCDFRFDAAPAPIESGMSAQSGEWRSMWTGVARSFIGTSEQVALITSIITSVTTPDAAPETSTTT